MRISYRDNNGNRVLSSIDSSSEIGGHIHRMDNHLAEFIHIEDEDVGMLTIIGPDKGRFQIFITKNVQQSDGTKFLASKLIDTKLKNDSAILDIGYHGGSDPVEIFRTVPIDVAVLVAQEFITDKAIYNHVPYIWEGDIEPV